MQADFAKLIDAAVKSSESASTKESA